MDELQQIIGNNSSLEDIQWLCSLSEPELDMLIRLKTLAVRRAEKIGHAELAKKFDLKMLRALGLIVMEGFKGKLMEVQGLNVSAAFMDGCNLLKYDCADALSVEELKKCLGVDERKKGVKRRYNETVSNGTRMTD